MITYKSDADQPEKDGNDTYFNRETWSQNTDEAETPDHAVCIVGWDDNYSKDNFADGHIPEGGGAWIVKNTWGAEEDIDGSSIDFPNKNDWGIVDEKTGKHTGYFYLSYYDKSISAGESFDFQNPSSTEDPIDVLSTQ